MSTMRMTVAGLTLGWLAAASCAVAAGPGDGFLYGTVKTTGGSSYSGVLRWGTEEAFWDDLFQSSKEELPYLKFGEKLDREKESARSTEHWWELFGRTLKVAVGGPSRVVIARFGDIRSIKVTGEGEAELTMKSGSKLRVSGYANDVEATITVRDAAVGTIDVPWGKIESITFAATPSDVELPGQRLYGTVVTESGAFTGFVQWDSQEALTTDILDGDSEDGRLEIPMGKLRSIERRSRTSSSVTLEDGRTLVLDGTNDVDGSIRGICVEDPRFGRVKVPWDAFVKADFQPGPGSGPAYDAYTGGHPLTGTVVDRAGKEYHGRFVFDLDETETWEMLNGSAHDIEYNIPFERVTALAPDGTGTMVNLRDGGEIRLEDAQDVSRDNDGVIALALEGKDLTHVPWAQVRRITLER